MRGFTFYVDVANDAIDRRVEAGFSQEEAFRLTVAELARDFALATETVEVIFAEPITTLLSELAIEGDSALDTDEDLFDVTGSFRPEATQLDGVTTLLELNSVAGAEEIGGVDANGEFVVAGDADAIDTLRLAGDADVRIDLTDPSEQLEGIDIDGSGAIEFDEQDQAFRDIIDVSNFDIIDAHPRGDALLNPTLTSGDPANIGFSGDLFFDGTGFDGTGTNLNGNIVLGGYGADVIFTGNGNDFVSSGGLDDNIKTGRNADFIYQELSRLDDTFSGDDGEIDGGATFDDSASADSDWLLLEASDDEEPVVVSLSSASNSEFFDVNAGDTGVDIDDFLAQLIAGEDIGVISTRLGNDAARIQNIENVNASGNFYKFFDEAVSDQQSTAYIAAGTFLNFDEQAPLVQAAIFTGDVNGTAFTVELGADDLAGVTDLDSLRTAVQAAFDANPITAGLVNVPLSTDPVEDTPEIFRSESNPDVGPVDPSNSDVGVIGPIALVVANEGSGLTFGPDNPQVAVDEAEDVRSDIVGLVEIENVIPDLFFGDNRDFSLEAAEYRVPGLSPGVTAQTIIVGSSAESSVVDGVSVGITAEDGGNILIAGYDNDEVYGLGGSDLLMGGDLEFLLTHRHNPNLFDTSAGTISVNGADGVADDGRDVLIGGGDSDNLVWEADGGIYGGDSSTTAGSDSNDDGASDTLWLTTFSVGRLTTVARSTDASVDEFLAITPVVDSEGVIVDGIVADQDFTGLGEAEDELDTVNAVTTDRVLRFDLGVGAGTDYQGNGADLPFRGDLAGADRAGTADQTNYRDGFSASTIVDVEDFNASGLGAIDYLAAGVPGDLGTDLTFENRQNYRGTNADIDIRGIDDLSTGSGSDIDNDFTTARLVGDFNTNYVNADGSDLADLLYTASESGNLAVAETSAGDSAAENELFTNRGDDVLEGRGGDDWLEGRQGNDIFIVSTNDSGNGPSLGGVDEEDEEGSFGDVVVGDNINIIARRLDADADGLVDTGVGSDKVAIGRDFRLDLEDDPDTIQNVVTFQLQPAEDIDVPGGVDNWLTVSTIRFNFTDGTSASIAINSATTTVANATQAAAIIDAALGAEFTVVAGETAIEDPDTDEDDLDPGFVDAVFISFDPDVVQLSGDPLVFFTSDAGEVGNSSFGIEGEIETIVTEAPDVLEDDEVVFRSYQERTDDESIPDRQASLGREAYAEDLVVGVQDGTTKLVEGQEYRIFVDDLKENDTMRLTLNGETYTRTVDFEGSATSQTTLEFLEEFADQINDEIMRDPHSRDGWIFVDVIEGETDNSAALVIREREASDDEAEHVFLQFPEVSITNSSGGDAPAWVVKETSDTAVVLFDYDYRDLENTDGLNRGVGVFEQRDGGTLSTDNTRFITFEDTTGLNRAILQDGEDGDAVVEGLDITYFNQPGAPDFRDGDDAFEDGLEVLDTHLDDYIAANNTGYLPEDNDSEAVAGNGGGRGQPQVSFGEGESYSALNGDDNLRGGSGVDTLLGYTGDDRITAGENFNLLFEEVYDGGVNIVVDNATGAIVEDLTNSYNLDQTADDDETLLDFVDTLIIEEGSEETDRAAYAAGSLFTVAIPGVAEDFGLNGTLSVDDDQDGLIEHTATILNMEVIRTLSDTEADTLD
ncbi:MAG: hypothetical protein AAFV86_12590, partial [Pseudomonadota bacterium]